MIRRIGRWLLAATAVVVLAAGAGRAEALGIGDPAPKIAVKRFVKGQPVTAFQPGKTYVVEFWATWCGPCRVSIPHLTELQKKYPAVTFVGVSVWEQDQTKVDPFVKQMGQKMAYRVAMDSVPPNGSGDNGVMATSWMKAAGQEGIPTAFIVDTKGKIAWIGHPMELEEPLAAVVAGKWDTRAAIAKAQKEKEQQAKLQGLQAKLQAAQQSGDPKKLLEVVDEALQGDKSLEPQLGFPKFRLMADTGADSAQVGDYGQHLVDEVYQDNPQALNAIAWSLIDPQAKKPQPKLAPLALKAAQKADELVQRKRADVADTLARAYFVNGQADKAVETQTRAIQLAKGTDLEKDPSLKARLEEYQKAAHK